jgi:hypothetical protein
MLLPPVPLPWSIGPSYPKYPPDSLHKITPICATLIISGKTARIHGGFGQFSFTGTLSGHPFLSRQKLWNSFRQTPSLRSIKIGTDKNKALKPQQIFFQGVFNLE